MKRTSFAILIGLFCLFPALFSQVRSEFLLEKNRSLSILLSMIVSGNR